MILPTPEYSRVRYTTLYSQLVRILIIRRDSEKLPRRIRKWLQDAGAYTGLDYFVPQPVNDPTLQTPTLPHVQTTEKRAL